ncbi:FAD-dependent oxidoreductase [Methanoculleus sp. Wushi-C6]|uniref:FAD-dependent oxidoreductase n=1 Tax=Methanoculleus caldifontis TaxID=2651577 RepID=A0ABU3X354_9EURY|nr:FAD-dependent oxidoreductase [Methanoculleus sp. Wushi-C6]MDV2482494.1 FAD-dependent oxidoreductase [Methanoculleus sp. Wushi-C6]
MVYGPGEGYSLPGRHGSFWMETTAGVPHPPLSGNIETDVAVVGGGIAGITTAFLLKQAGYAVALIEAGRLSAGVTGHTTAKLTALHRLIYADLIDQFGSDLAQQYADANQTAVEQVASLIREYEIPCDFIRRPAYTYAESPDSRESVAAEADAARSLGLPAAFVEEVPLPGRTYGAVRFTDQAQFHPVKYLLSLASLIPGDGSRIYENTRAVEVRDEKGALCEVRTENGTVTARSVVLATHYPFYDSPGFYYARMEPSYSYVLGVRLDEPFPDGMFINAESPAHSWRSQPAGDGELVLVGGMEHRTGEDVDTREHYRALERYARTIYPLRSVDYRWSTEDYITNDGVPYIGPLADGHENVYIATGFRKWGMTNGTVAGLIITDMIRGRENPWSEVYAPGRFKPVASARRFLVHNIEVAEKFIGGAISRPSGEIRDVRPGEGRIMMVEGEKTGVYRDREGRVRAVNPTCTHMGCIAAWNSAEETWDCPCHGSRYDASGKVIHGPAVKDLAPRGAREE